MKKMRVYAAAAMLVMGLSLSACGGGDSEKGSQEASAKTESTAKGGYSFHQRFCKSRDGSRCF